MTRISFYKQAGSFDESLILACRLVEKAYSAKQQVLCQVPNNDVAEELDHLLWTIPETGFIPHGKGSSQIPVAISIDKLPGEHYQLLINLCTDIPKWFARFERIIEIVYCDQDYEDSKRDNFRYYKERGYALDFFDLTAKK